MESPIEKMLEKSFVSEELLRVADQILDQAEGVHVFRSLGLGYDGENPMYISEDASRLPVVVHQFERDGKTYFLGYTKE